MNKQNIIQQIHEITKVDGTPPGRQRFEKVTGIKRHVWYGKHWAKWGDALLEAGYNSNRMKKAYPKEELLKYYLNFVQELQKIPSDGELRIRRTNDSNFPSYNTFQRELGSKENLLTALLEFAKSEPAPEDIIQLIISSIKAAPSKPQEKKLNTTIGYIYIIRSGEFFKIGRSNDFDRRLREIKTKLPEECELIHVIETDDPEGIEVYWHNRFKNHRAKGEWFKLSNDDVKALRKRKFM